MTLIELSKERWFIKRDGSYIEIDNGRRGSKYLHVTNQLPIYDGGPKDRNNSKGVSVKCLARAKLIAAAPKLLRIALAYIDLAESVLTDIDNAEKEYPALSDALKFARDTADGICPG